MLELGWLTVLLGVLAMLGPTAHLRKEAPCQRSARDPLNRAASNVQNHNRGRNRHFGRIGFFDLGREAYTLAALLLGIGALLDYSQRRAAPPRH